MILGTRTVSLLCLISIFWCAKGTCPSGWNEITGISVGCYKVSLQQKNYKEHELSCRENGGHLTSIHSTNELHGITSLLRNTNGHFFIGLTDISQEGTWEYSDLTPFDFSNWEYGEPNDSGEEDCVEIKTSGKWNDISCSKNCGSICKLERDDSTLETTEYSVTDYVAIMMDLKGGTVTPEESNVPTEYVTEVYSSATVTENEILNDYETKEYNEGAVSTELNGIATTYLDTQYSAASSTENAFLTGYITKELKDADQSCPGEWFRFKEFCYFVDTTKRVFRDAKLVCQARGGQLASIHTEEEQSFVYSILREDVQSYFIGLTFDTKTKTWNYTDGTPFDFTNWYPNMPDGGDFESCVEVYFYHDGQWNDVSCFSPFNGAVCKATFGSSLVSGPLNDPDHNMKECGHGWLNYYDESLYCFIDIPLQWTEAAQMCVDYGGHLLTIKDQYEKEFLLRSMVKFSVEFVWIGMSDLQEEGVWRREDTQTIPSYTSWDYLEPNNQHNEDCAVMYFFWNFIARRGEWYDVACCHEFPSVCKKQF